MKMLTLYCKVGTGADISKSASLSRPRQSTCTYIIIAVRFEGQTLLPFTYCRSAAPIVGLPHHTILWLGIMNCISVYRSLRASAHRKTLNYIRKVCETAILLCGFTSYTDVVWHPWRAGSSLQAISPRDIFFSSYDCAQALGCRGSGKVKPHQRMKTHDIHKMGL